MQPTPVSPLQAARLERGWTLTQAAQMMQQLCPGHGHGLRPCHMTASKLSKYEHGHCRPEVRHIEVLCGLYQRSSEDLGLIIWRGDAKAELTHPAPTDQAGTVGRRAPRQSSTSPSPLRAARLASGWTQLQAVHKARTLCRGHEPGPCRMPVNKLSEYEIGTRRPDVPHIEALCRLYGRSPEDLGLIVWRDPSWWRAARRWSRRTADS